MRFAVLTRRDAHYGAKLLERLEQYSLKPAGVVVETLTLHKRFRMARLLARKTGWQNAVDHNLRFWRQEVLCVGKRIAAIDYTPYCNELWMTRNLNGSATEAFLGGLELDLLVLGQSGIVRPNILRLPRTGTLNAHPGRLPEMRGVDVVKWALWQRCPVHVTLHFVDAGVDTGDMIEREQLMLRPDMTIEDVEAAATDLSIELLVDAIRRHAASEPLKCVAQDRGSGRQYYLMPRATRNRLRAEWPDIRAKLLSEQSHSHVDKP